MPIEKYGWAIQKSLFVQTNQNSAFSNSRGNLKMFNITSKQRELMLRLKFSSRPFYDFNKMKSNFFETITMKSKWKQYSEMLLRFQGDAKKTWRVVKEMIGKS